MRLSASTPTGASCIGYGAAEALFGYPAGEVLGRSCFDIIHGRDEHDHTWCRGNCHVAVGARAGGTGCDLDTWQAHPDQGVALDEREHSGAAVGG